MYINIIIGYNYIQRQWIQQIHPQIEQNNLNKFNRQHWNYLQKKNIDYGDAFAKFGVVGVLMRIEDKIQRALSITKNNITLVDDENIQDTLIDLHNYAGMALMLLDN